MSGEAALIKKAAIEKRFNGQLFDASDDMRICALLIYIFHVYDQNLKLS